ncbi:MAG: MmcQ/YjbR family DNA-binding protein [Alistipes sp.]|nr:MmcQ/YjbR family DNA-binding protein [Alistipes sp.]
MDIVDFREFCLTLPEVEESMPFGDTTLVFKIGGKIFAMVGLDRADHIAVKCDPDRALVLRDSYWQIRAAWHLNKRHWNDIYFEGLTDEFVRREIRHSYMLVLQGVSPKSLREQLCAIAAEEGVVDDAEIG